MIAVSPYAVADKECWDAFANNAVNSHFMFQRGYMDYHSDRFLDASYLVYKNEQLIGIFPGCNQGLLWASHAGLTFGGLLLHSKNNRIGLINDIYPILFNRLKADGYNEALIKPLPWIYHQSPAEGELYVLQQRGLLERYVEVTATVDLRSTVATSTLRKRQQKKAIKNGLAVLKDHDYKSFWQVLSFNLESKYGRAPVHTLTEIEKLSEAFPEHIALYRVEDKAGECLGGSLIFKTSTLWHAQYISATETGMKLGALDLLFMFLIDEAREQGRYYFDFGISTECNGSMLNESLASFKEGFGARSVIHQKIKVRL